MKRLPLCCLLLCLATGLFAQSPGYYLLEGKIGSRAACMEIAVYPVQHDRLPEEIPPVSAYYYFLDEYLPIALYRSTDADDTGVFSYKNARTASLVLSTWSDEGDNQVFTGNFEDRSYRGKLAMGKDTIAFDFLLSDKGGVERFTPFERHRIVTVGSDSLKEPLEGTMQFRGFLPDDGRLAEAFTSFITGGAFTDFGVLAEEQIGLFEEGYQAEMAELLEEIDEQFSYTLHYEYAYSVYPMLNTTDYLIMGYNTFSYTGGAHGISSQRFYTYRKGDKRWLQLEDILDVSQEAVINAVLDAELRKQYGIAPDVKLSDDKQGIFIADSIHYSSNFILSKQGITFHYGLYELTPYAYGYFSLFVPYEKLRAVLRAGFRYDSVSVPVRASRKPAVFQYNPVDPGKYDKFYTVNF
ncbi:RsiV family protein [Parapedobacter lycopersici]|uniref:RsiV family protein n=1 Tax=Parapedobacter lycopersici TaxID=1864939 RepID=UPI00214DB5CE|nr:RsiV family protein [Parapedobacter lycopersici]